MSEIKELIGIWVGLVIFGFILLGAYSIPPLILDIIVVVAVLTVIITGASQSEFLRRR